MAPGDVELDQRPDEGGISFWTVGVVPQEWLAPDSIVTTGVSRLGPKPLMRSHAPTCPRGRPSSLWLP
jgi:hypothetical protein